MMCCFPDQAESDNQRFGYKYNNVYRGELRRGGGEEGVNGGSVSKIVYPIIEPACTTLIGTMNNLTKVK